MADLICNVPITFTDADLIYTDVTEDDYAAWNSGTTYAKGARVIRTTTHKIYESLQASNLNKTPESQPTWWIEVSATNRWKLLDGSLFQATSVSGTMRYYWALPSAIDTVGLAEVEGGNVYVGLIETSSPGARRNLMTFSEFFDNVIYSLVGTVFNPTKQRSPWDAFTAQAMREDTSTGGHYIEGGNVSYTSGLAYTFSVYVKRGDGSRNASLQFPASAFSGAPFAIFSLTNGSVLSSSGITASSATSLGNGWYRFRITATATSTTSATGGRLYITSGTSNSYTGVTTQNIYFIGWQTEQASTASTYQFIATSALYGERTYSDGQVMTVTGSGALTDAIFTGIPGSAGDLLEVAVYADSGTSKLGELVAGTSYIIGEIVNSAQAQEVSYDKREFDETFGTLTFLARPGRKVTTFNVLNDRDDMASRSKFLRFVRRVSCHWYTDGNLTNSWGLATLGRVQEVTYDVNGSDVVILPITIDGIV